MGFSTLTEALIFHRTATKENVNSLIIAHKDDATSNLFSMSKLFYNELPSMLKPHRKASNAKELIFDSPARAENIIGLNSKIKCATAGGDGVGPFRYLFKRAYIGVRLLDRKQDGNA